jgi:hypothetical protein
VIGENVEIYVLAHENFVQEKKQHKRLTAAMFGGAAVEKGGGGRTESQIRCEPQRVEFGSIDRYHGENHEPEGCAVFRNTITKSLKKMTSPSEMLGGLTVLVCVSVVL